MLGAWFYQVLVSTMLSPRYHLVTMLDVWFYKALVSTMLRLLSSHTDNARSRVLSSIGKYLALAFVIAYSEHGFIKRSLVPCSACCYRLLTIVGA